MAIFVCPGFCSAPVAAAKALSCPQCKDIDEVWAKRVSPALQSENNGKVWENNNWKVFEIVYNHPIAETSATSTASSCSLAPMDSSKVKGFNNSPHTLEASGHGVVRTDSPAGAVDLRSGTTCAEAVSLANTIPLFSPIEGYVSQTFELKETGDNYGSCIIIASDQNCRSRDCNAENIAVLCHADLIGTENKLIQAGAVVGRLTQWECNSGSFGPHLHFELKLNGKWVTGDGFAGTWRNQLQALGCST